MRAIASMVSMRNVASRLFRGEKLMTPDPSQVIVGTEDYAPSSLHFLCVHHRDFPELRGEGPSPHSAAVHLAERMTLTLDNVPSGWRRDIVVRALEDVRAFAEQGK